MAFIVLYWVLLKIEFAPMIQASYIFLYCNPCIENVAQKNVKQKRRLHGMSNLIILITFIVSKFRLFDFVLMYVWLCG